MIVLPVIVLPELSPNSADLAILAAAIAAAFVIFEYGFTTPSLIEFRFAAPYNRFRFAILALLLTGIAFSFSEPVSSTGTSLAVSGFATKSAQLWNFAGSPLTFFEALTANMGATSQRLVTNAAALALSLTAITLLVSSVVIWNFSWPLHAENFNLWINMPNFDVAMDGETQGTLRQSGLVSLIFGLTLPYLIPQAAFAFVGPLQPINSGNSLLLLWMIVIWCFVPAVSILRAVALYKVANLLAAQSIDLSEPEDS
ncbi:hypothetical protein [Neptunicoccus sediminis]|uniref:hypothetical protein n=1 Tax=Neptunicoccus sediminis TaxID=1892596 RepID=UPI000845D6E7|nr:hypothetical protein [Neptunicoccus sediminis]